MGNGDLIMKSVKCAVLLLMTEPAAVPDLLDVARAVKRLWLLQRRRLRYERLEEVAQRQTDIEMVAFMGLCRVETLSVRGTEEAIPRFADAVNELCGQMIVDTTRRPLGAKELGISLTQVSDSWYGMGPGDRPARYVRAASLAFGACAAVVEWPGGAPRGSAPAVAPPPPNHPGWYDDGGKLTASGVDDIEALCWGTLRSAFFLTAQARISGCVEFSLPPAMRARALDVVVDKIVPQLDPTQFAESAYNRYLRGSSQPGDCALYSRQTGNRPCTVIEAMQYVRRGVYKEAILLLSCDLRAAIMDAGWPEGTHRALCRRLSQFTRETVLVGAMGTYCTTRGGTENRVRAYTELEHAEFGWWTPPAIAYPCIVRAGSFWLLIGADKLPAYYSLDVVDAISWLIVAISEGDRSCDSLVSKLGLDSVPDAPGASR